MIDLTALVGAERAAAILDEADDAYAALRTFVENEQIDCALDHCGRFVTATTPAMFDKLVKKMAEYNEAELDEPFELVTAERQREWVGSDLFVGGMAVANAGTIDPGRYTQGLVERCRAAGVRLVGQLPVDSVEQTSSGFEVTAGTSTVRAGQVVVATNGYTGKLTPWLRRRIVPMSSTIAVTEPIDPTLVTALLPKRAAYIDGRRLITYARPSPDGTRILFGGRARFRPISPTEAAGILHSQMVEVFPELEDIGFTHAWTGFMAFTTDFLPKIGMLDGMHFAVGCNGGSGVVAMSWLGRKVAHKILGEDDAPSPLEGMAFDRQPAGSLTKHFIPVAGTWYRARDWYDHRPH
jgi:glycine/D-amino acid oxidase-like deaminating enzyme